MELEIRVAENVFISESLGDILTFIEREIKKFIEDDTRNVLDISIKKNLTRGPPALGVYASEVMKIGEALA
jgi:CRISPR/Cas system-associated endoribonuclease Cas2